MKRREKEEEEEEEVKWICILKYIKCTYIFIFCWKELFFFFNCAERGSLVSKSIIYKIYVLKYKTKQIIEVAINHKLLHVEPVLNTGSLYNQILTLTI